MIEILVTVALALGYAEVDPRILQAVDSACVSDVKCAIDEMVFAAAESGFNEHPKPFSHDSKDGTSCGVWQEPCHFVNSHSLEEQAAYWRDLRAWSQKVCSPLPEQERMAALASGGCYHGRMLSRARWETAQDVLFASRWSIR